MPMVEFLTEQNSEDVLQVEIYMDGLKFVFVADEAFPLLDNILKPYPMWNLTQQQKIYNYRVSRARGVVENAFSIMSNRFRIFHTAINLSLPKIDAIAECVSKPATTCLHLPLTERTF